MTKDNATTPIDAEYCGFDVVFPQSAMPALEHLAARGGFDNVQNMITKAVEAGLISLKQHLDDEGEIRQSNPGTTTIN